MVVLPKVDRSVPLRAPLGLENKIGPPMQGTSVEGPHTGLAQRILPSQAPHVPYSGSVQSEDSVLTVSKAGTLGVYHCPLISPFGPQ